jgi:hypothetical protein
MVESAVNKLLHAPTTRLKASAAEGDAAEYVGAIRHLFDLPENSPPPSGAVIDGSDPGPVQKDDDGRVTH